MPVNFYNDYPLPQPGKPIKAPQGNIRWGTAILAVRKVPGNTFKKRR